jgi:hypothetical protein
MEDCNWKTQFKGFLVVKLSSGEKTRVFNPGRSRLSIFASQALRILKDEFLTGCQIEENWEIIRFLPEERFLEIKEKNPS